MNLFIPFLHTKKNNFNLKNNQHKITLPLFTFHNILTKKKLKKKKKKITLKSIFINQLKLPPKIYNYLKKSNIHTLLKLLNNNQKNLLKIKHFHIKNIKYILNFLKIKKHFA
ncbi:hypothetical protein E2H86_25585 [Pseudomonas putida]|nr:hypothetical protein E2H86_25585 [Pseudomonas putida]